MTKPLVVAVVICVATVSVAQSNQKPVTSENLRGLSAPSANVVWASGTHGTYVVTINGGRSWSVAQVPGAESLDFRDVEAFSRDLAYLLAAGPGKQSRIYKTVDGGRNWALQFTNRDPKGFFDCMGFWDKDHGIAIGDPVNGKFQLIKTENGGKEWKPIPADNLPAAIEGEGAFAASGTCLVTKNDNDVWFATGGNVARVFRSTDRGKNWKVAATPILAGEASQGIFSIAFKNNKEGIAVGGDYKKPASARDNIATTADGGATWQLQHADNSVYLSAVTYLERGQILACGPEGGMEFGMFSKSWNRASARCNAAKYFPPGTRILAGPGGDVIMLESNYTDEHGPEGGMKNVPSTNIEPTLKSQMLE